MIKTQEKTPFLMRLRYKYLTFFFLKKAVWAFFRFVLLVGISYIILFPYISKIAGSFMSRDDFTNVMVKLIAMNPTLDTYKAIITDNNYFEALFNTTVLSVLCGVSQTLICSIIGYGFAKFKFRFKNILFLCVIFTMIVPHETIQLSMFMKFRYFDILGIMNLLGGGVTDSISILEDTSLNLLNSYWPLWIMSATGLAFKNGLYIFMLRQFFRGIPDSLEESAYIDGSGDFKTFIRIIIPMSVPMMITVFLFSFSWQWTDDFYTGLFFTNNKTVLMSNIYSTIPKTLSQQFNGYAGWNLYSSAIRNTSGLLIMIPLVIMFLFCQKFLVQGIERSGITG